MHDTCTIHGIRILITNPPKLDNKPHVTRLRMEEASCDDAFAPRSSNNCSRGVPCGSPCCLMVNNGAQAGAVDGVAPLTSQLNSSIREVQAIAWRCGASRTNPASPQISGPVNCLATQLLHNSSSKTPIPWNAIRYGNREFSAQINERHPGFGFTAVYVTRAPPPAGAREADGARLGVGARRRVARIHCDRPLTPNLPLHCPCPYPTSTNATLTL